MARTAYQIETVRDATLVSSNGTSYTINILWPGTGSGTDFVVGSGGVKISYESAATKTKNSRITTSSCSISYMITNATEKALVQAFATDYNERDIWVTIRQGSTFIWCGYLLLDLKTEQDVSYPYEVELKAIDGLAALKEIPFIKHLDSSGAVPSFPYSDDDTYMNDGYLQLIGTSTSWLTELMDRTGMLVAADDKATSPILENYSIQTAVNLFNEEHPTPTAATDPLYLTKINMINLYTVDDDNYVQAPNCYSVLETICKNFNMRCIYWQNIFYFIENDQYNTDPAAASTPSVPINIPTREYYYNGGHRLDQNFIGRTDFSQYEVTLENATNPGEGLQKLAGAAYTGLPPIKKVIGIYYTSSTPNVWRGIQTAYTGFSAPLSANDPEQRLQYKRNASGALCPMSLFDTKDSSGIKVKFYLSFKNTASRSFYFQTMWMLRAVKHGSAFSTSKILTRTVVAPYEYVWIDWTSATANDLSAHSSMPRNGTTANKTWAMSNCLVPPASSINQNVGVLAYDSAIDPFATNGLIPVDTAFEDGWSFYMMTWEQWMPTPLPISSASSFPNSHTRGWTGSYKSNGTNQENYGGTRTHNSVSSIPVAGTNYAGVAMQKTQGTYPGTVWRGPQWYQYDYDNTLNPNPTSANPYMGTFQAQSTTSSLPLHVEVSVQGNNTYEIDGGLYLWGEGESVKVWDGAAWVYASPYGKWTKPTYAWNAGTSQFDYTVGAYNQKLVQILFYQMIYNQSIALNQFNGSTALSSTDKVHSGTSLLKFMNPIARLTDVDSKDYTLLRGTFDLLQDSWDVTSNQVFYEVPSETVNYGEAEQPGEIKIAND